MEMQQIMLKAEETDDVVIVITLPSRVEINNALQILQSYGLYHDECDEMRKNQYVRKYIRKYIRDIDDEKATTKLHC